jgi:predicted tellurium resistance membrane protein TerC
MAGIVLGAGVAILLRIVFTVAVQSLLDVPWLKVIGGVLLLWIAIKLLIDRNQDEEDIASATGLIKANKLKNINQYQKINHFPGAWHLGRKDNLWRNVFKMKRTHG